VQRDPDAPEPEARKRRGGEKEGGGPIIMRPVAHAARPAARGRYARLRGAKASTLRHGFTNAAADTAAQAQADTGLYLADTCAWLQAWENNTDYAQMHDSGFDAIQDQYFPQP
jgi:hypothetical protein